MEKENNLVSSFFLDKRFRIYRHLLLITVIVLFTSDLVWFIPDEQASIPVKYIGWIIYMLFFGIAIYTNLYILIPGILFKNRILIYLLFLLFVIFITCVVLLLVQKYLFNLGLSYEWLLEGGFFIVLSSAIILSLMFAGTTTILLFKQSIEYNKRINELESSTLQSELGLLRNQINPHFLFNTLNNANMLLEGDGTVASDVIFKLEDLLRYQIEDCTKDKVQLSSDIHFLNDYLNLEKIRRDNFEYTISKQGDINRIRVAPLLFITFVENAVKHSSDTESLSYIHLSFKEDNGKLIFECKNSKPARANPNNKGGIGLNNIKRRLELLYPNHYLLDIRDEIMVFSISLELIL